MLAVMIVLGIVYLNIGIAIGLHIHRKPGLDFNNNPAPLLGLIWPVLGGIFIPKYLKDRREKKQAKALEAKVAAKALSSPENDPLSEARALAGLQEKVERMKREIEELGEEIGKRQADSEVAKAVSMLNDRY